MESEDGYGKWRLLWRVKKDLKSEDGLESEDGYGEWRWLVMESEEGYGEWSWLWRVKMVMESNSEDEVKTVGYGQDG